MKFYHTTGNGHVYNGHSDALNLTEFKRRLRKSYGNLRGVRIVQANNYQEAYKKLFFPHDK
jgi:hypothetical protein